MAFVGTGEPELGPRQGPDASITFGYQNPPARTRAAWPAPGFKGYRPRHYPLESKGNVEDMFSVTDS